MKKVMFLALILIASTSSIALAADDEAALKTQMKQVCAPLFAKDGPCADLIKGTRKCVRQNLDKAEPDCAKFEKEHKDFFDAGMKDEMIKK